MAVPTQLAYRTLKGIGVLNTAPTYEPLPNFERPEGNLRCCTYSPDGRYFAWAYPERVSVIDASTGSIVTQLPTENVYELGFSPKGTYVITWQRPTRDEQGNTTNNLKVWRTIDEAAPSVEERRPVGAFVQKSQTGWNLQYTDDEALCARVVTNEVQIWQSEDLGKVWGHLKVEGVTDFAIAPGKTHSVAVFVPERKGAPAAVKLFTVPNFDTPISQKTFFKGDKVQFKWNNAGNSIIILASTDVDKSNKSYYGETNMYILSANGGFDARIALDKEGPVHDVSWSPNSKEFGVVYGYMPAKTVIFNQRAVAQHTFPLGPRNTILFSPHGRVILVAGFGNLAGQMDIYDAEKDFSKITTIEGSNPSVCEWSPDGKHILTATTSPRLRVDNGIRIWHMTGKVMYNEDMNELYHVQWRPQPASMHSTKDLLEPSMPHPSADAYMSTRKTPSKPVGAYRPPGARGTSTPLHFKREDEGGSAFINDGISSNSGGVNGFGPGRAARGVPGVPAAVPGVEPLPPGAAPGGGVSLTGTGEDGEALSKAALKNKKKREAKKQKEAEAKAAGLTTEAPAAAAGATPNAGRSPERKDRSNHQRNRSKPGNDYRSRSHSRNGSGKGMDSFERRVAPTSHAQQAPQQPAAQGGKVSLNEYLANNTQPSTPKAAPPTIDSSAASVAPAPDVTVTSPGGGGSSQEKKVRSLLKKLRAIEELKMRQAGGEKLEDTQVKKIGTEEGIRQELRGCDYDGPA